MELLLEEQSVMEDKDDKPFIYFIILYSWIIILHLSYNRT